MDRKLYDYLVRKDCRSGFDIEMEKPGYEILCSLLCIQKSATNFGTTVFASTHSAAKRASEINPERENRLHCAFWRWNNGRTHLVEHELVGKIITKVKEGKESGRSRHRKRRGRRSEVTKRISAE